MLIYQRVTNVNKVSKVIEKVNELTVPAKQIVLYREHEAKLNHAPGSLDDFSIHRSILSEKSGVTAEFLPCRAAKVHCWVSSRSFQLQSMASPPRPRARPCGRIATVERPLFQWDSLCSDSSFILAMYVCMYVCMCIYIYIHIYHLIIYHPSTEAINYK